MNRPETTLFMLSSVDGKISTGDNDSMDVDKDFPKIEGVREGLSQYYELEQTTDLFSLTSGKVLAKIGINDKSETSEKSPVSFIVIDNKPHLDENGIKYLTSWLKKLYIVTNNDSHPAYNMEIENLEVLPYDSDSFVELFSLLKDKYQIEKLTLQTGGTLNAAFLREGLIDNISLVLAPCLVGGKDTPSLIDGESLHSVTELSKIKSLKLVECKILENSYIHLRYQVNNSQ
jgi:2,5-diamino-6-(ribosylamino)-4(3H)-pyrimidinone 5'-phosphate reductase